MKATRGNVFSDLGFSLAEARNLQMRAQLMTALRRFVEKEGLTQAEAAKRLASYGPNTLQTARRTDALSQLAPSLQHDPLFNVPRTYTDNYHYILNVSPQVVEARTQIYSEFKAA